MSSNMPAKLAFKPSKDPAQTSLKQHKKEWGEKVKKFNKMLIALKQAVNGIGVPPLNVPPSRLHEPLPDEIPRLLNQLAQIYQSLTQEGLAIVQEQEQHAEQVGQRRSQKTKETLEQPEEQPEMSPETRRGVPQPIGGVTPVAADDSQPLVKEAANIFTRLWSYIKTPFQFGDQDRWARMRMLRATAELERLIKEIEHNLASTTPNSIAQAVYLTKDLGRLVRNDLSEPLIQLFEKHHVAQKQKVSEEVLDLSEDIFNEYVVSRVAPGLQQYAKYREVNPHVAKVKLAVFSDGSRGFIQLMTESPDEEISSSAEEPEAPAPMDPFAQVERMDAQVSGWVKDVTAKKAQVSEIEDENIKNMLSGFLSTFDRIAVNYYETRKQEKPLNSIQEAFSATQQAYQLAEQAIVQHGQMQQIASVDPSFIKLAQGRWYTPVLRKWTEWFGGRDKNLRRTALGRIDQMKSELNKVMDLLQTKNVGLTVLRDQIRKFNIVFAGLLQKLNDLADMHNNQFRILPREQRRELRQISETDRRELLRLEKILEASLNPKLE